MRAQGISSGPGGAAQADHVCRVYDDEESPAGVAREYAPPFRVWFEDDVLTLAGELDALGAERLGRVLAASPVRRPVVVLDLARVEFVDVSGCRAIARWALDLQDRGARLALLGTSRLFRRMWTVLGFADATGVPLP